MENRRPPRRSCKQTRSGWEIGGLEGVFAEKLGLGSKIGRLEAVVEEAPGRRSCRETRSGWKIGGLQGVVADKLDLDGK